MDIIDRAQQLEEKQREIAINSRAKLTASVSTPVPDHRECEDCGEDIPRQRLEIYPSATRCTVCESKFEKRQERMK